MKKIFFALIAALFIGCGGDTGAANAEDKSEQPQDPEVEKGLQLIAASDCLGCHKVSEAATGPAYEAIAARYEATPAVMDTLVKKIIRGGAGNWGQIPMAAHPNIPEADARLMVKYILSLKK